ncbi:MFS transporter [Ferroplasma sp.]|uniref:MFS transporter n=1 Tax=Ferroplasma sp. TaxID=2591003 RepID=UPI00307F115B
MKSFKYIFGMNSIYLGNNYLWTSFESLFLPFEIELLMPEKLQSIYLGMIAFTGIMIGISFNFFSGTISDLLNTRIGRRRPLILLGSGIVIISLLAFVIINKSILSVFLMYIMIEIGSNIAYGAYQPLIRDVIPSNQRSTSSGISGFFTLLGSAFGFGISGLLMGMHLLFYAIIIILITILITALTNFFTIQKDDYISKSELISSKLFKFIKNLNASKKFKWMYIANLFITIGSSGLIFFEYYYFEYDLNLKNTAIYVAIAGVSILLISALSAVAIGILADRINKEILLLIFPLTSGISILLISFIHNFYIFLVLGSIIGISYGNYFVITNSYMSFIVPHGRVGKYLSIFLVSTEIGSAFSPLLYGFILFIFKNLGPLAYSRLFEISSIFYLVGFIIILFKVINRKTIFKLKL